MKPSFKTKAKIALIPIKAIATTARMRKHPPLSGKPRSKIFSKSAFLFEVWKAASERSKIKKESFLATEALNDYVLAVDDLIDRMDHPDLKRDYLAYKKYLPARKSISGFVRQVKKMPLTREEKREIYKTTGKYRREAFSTLQEFYTKPKPTLKEILEMKEKTTGGMGTAFVSVLNILERVPKEKRSAVEKAFSEVFMAAQVADDMCDIHSDYAQRVPNIAIGVLQKHPQEFGAAMKMQRVSFNAFKQACPNTFKELIEIYNHYTARIPQNSQSTHLMTTFSNLFLKLLTLTARKASKTA